MATKPIINIEVDDKQFKAFFDLFNQFKEKLGDMPEDWKKINDAGGEAGEAMAAATGALVESMLQASEHAKTLGAHLKSATLAQKQFQVSTRHSESGLKKMAHEAEKVGKSIFGIGKFLFKTAAWGAGLFTGAAFGMDKLANATVGNRKSARQMGLTVGQYRAYNTDLGQNVGDSTLANVVKAKSDIAGRVYLGMATGLSSQQIGSMDAGSIAAILAVKEKQYTATHPDWTMQTIAGKGFTQLGESRADIMLHSRSSMAELQAAQAQYAKDSSTLNVSDKNTDELYSFKRQLTLAGQKLETALIDKLSALGPSLGSFITNLEKDAEILLNGIFTPANMKAIQAGLQSFAQYLGSGDFKSAVAAFVSGMKKMFHIVDVATSTASSITNPKPGTTWDKIDTAGDVLWKNGVRVAGAIWNPKAHWDAMMQAHNNPGNLRAAPGVKTVNGFADFANQDQGYAAMASLLKRYPTKYHADTLSKIITTYAPAKDHNNDKAYIANVAKWTGFSPNQHLNLNDQVVLSKVMAAMVRQEHGWKVTPDQVRDSVYNASLANGHGSVMQRLMGSMMKQKAPAKVQVNITNKSGTNVAVSANAAGI